MVYMYQKKLRLFKKIKNRTLVIYCYTKNSFVLFPLNFTVQYGHL